MADLDRRSVADLISAVGALIDMDITNNSSPNKTQVKRWLTDGAIQMFKLLPKEILVDCTISDTVIGSSAKESDLTFKLLKVASVLVNGRTATYEPEDAFGMLNLMPYRYSLQNPAYTIKKTPVGTEISVYPTSRNLYINVNYVPYPFSYIEDDEETIGDGTSVPATLEPMLVDYAMICYRNQDEEPGQFQLYMTEWKEQVKTSYQLPTQNFDGS